MSDLSRLLATPETIVHKGITYTLEPFTVEELSEYEVWIESRLWEAHKRSRRHLSDDEYNRNASNLLARIGQGEWSYPQPSFLQVLMTLEGCQKAVAIALRKHHKDVDEELADEIAASKFAEVLDKLMQTGADQPDPTTGTAGLPGESRSA